MMLFLFFILILAFVAMTRPGKSRLFRGRYRRTPTVRFQPLRPTNERVSDPTAGIRDPARPF